MPGGADLGGVALAGHGEQVRFGGVVMGGGDQPQHLDDGVDVRVTEFPCRGSLGGQGCERGNDTAAFPVWVERGRAAQESGGLVVADVGEFFQPGTDPPEPMRPSQTSVVDHRQGGAQLSLGALHCLKLHPHEGGSIIGPL